MFLKCPRCKDRAVLEREVGYLTWQRICGACGFEYTIRAQETGWQQPSEDPDLLLFDFASS